MKEITTLEELKSIELEMMKKIHDFCLDNNIKYTLSHGSMIGAVRHHGFIPWDDDIDLFMPRPDYEKFLSLFPKYQDELNLAIVNHKTPIYFCRPVSKVIDTRTLLVEKEFKGDDPIGVFIDLWPLDGCSDYKIIRKVHVFIVNQLLNILYAKIEVGSSGFCNKVRRAFFSYWKCDSIVECISKFASMFAYEKRANITCYFDPYRAVMKKDWFDKVSLVEFENLKLLCPDRYHNILSLIYGDYMKLPPIEKQKPHHIVDIWWK